MARARAGRYTDGADAPANSFEEAERATAKVLMFALAGLFVPFIVLVLMLVLVYERGVMSTFGRLTRPLSSRCRSIS